MKQVIRAVLKDVYSVVRIILKVHWCKTFYVNISLLPLNQAIKFPIVVTGKLIIDSLKGKVVFMCPIKFGLVNMGKDLDRMPVGYNPSRLMVDGTIIFRGPCVISQSSNVVTWEHGVLDIGKYVVVCTGVILKSECRVTVGDYSRLTSGCFIMDTNVHAMKDTVSGRIKPIFKEIEIGKGCWLTMYTSVMAGTKLPDYCITGRYTQLNRDYTALCEQGSLLVGAPAKVVKSGIQRLSNIKYEQEVRRFFINNPNADYFEGEAGFEILTDRDVAPHFRI